MIDSRALRRMAADTAVLVVDHLGRPIEDGLLPDDMAVPGLLAGPLAEAVKEVSAGRVVADLDRDAMWAVHGFVLDRNVLDALGDHRAYTAAELIRAVASAGFDWRPTPL